MLAKSKKNAVFLCKWGLFWQT